MPCFSAAWARASIRAGHAAKVPLSSRSMLRGAAKRRPQKAKGVMATLPIFLQPLPETKQLCLCARIAKVALCWEGEGDRNAEKTELDFVAPLPIREDGFGLLALVASEHLAEAPQVPQVDPRFHFGVCSPDGRLQG